MKTLYLHLAFDGIRRNRRLYIPYILTCIGMVMMHYILLFLYRDEGLNNLSGGATLRAIMQLGKGVIAVFAAVFLFYTHAFLMRRRKKEFGLYNILGMGKSNIGVILFWETLLVAAVSLAVGLLCGAAFSKLAELGLFRITNGAAGYTLSVSFAAIGECAATFGIIFLLLFLDSLRQVRFSSTAALLGSENVGEKPPRANWVLGLLGAVILAGAYATAVMIQDPVAAIFLFFVAVVLVIIGTYLVFVSGSVLLCRILQKNKRYYYKPAHFVSVSSMAFRMKRSGAGLASVCILATMVLVMISSTTCLYFGEEDAINARYPNDFRLEFVLPVLAAEDTDALRSAVLAEADACGVRIENLTEARDAASHDASRESYTLSFDTSADEDRQAALRRAFRIRFQGDSVEDANFDSCIITSKAVERDDFYGTFGGLFYLGILLSAVFICAAVLILYYKQITEASEDRARFAIMQKVGMTAREIRSSVNSQMLTVFYLPLLLAGVHLAFAFPMIRKLLSLFALNNVALFATTTLISFAVFALLYTLVYRVTAGAYCDIVGGEREA